MAILVTGGAGYIGSHTCVELLDAGYEVVVLDNLSNSSEKSLDRVRALTGKEVKFYKGDILDRDVLKKILETENIESCIHFAGLKAVGESVAKPWEYYNNNITGTLTLVDEMRKHGCKNIIFSSSATVYGDPAIIPITEECPKGTCTNPQADVWYGGTMDPHSQAGEMDLLEPYVSPNLDQIMPQFRDPAKRKGNYSSAVYVGILGFGVNKDRLKEKGLPIPTCWKDLVKPEYKGEIQIADPQSSGTAYTALATFDQLWGTEQAFDYLKKLNTNISQYTKSGIAPARNLCPHKVR